MPDLSLSPLYPQLLQDPEITAAAERTIESIMTYIDHLFEVIGVDDATLRQEVAATIRSQLLTDHQNSDWHWWAILIELIKKRDALALSDLEAEGSGNLLYLEHQLALGKSEYAPLVVWQRQHRLSLIVGHDLAEKMLPSVDLTCSGWRRDVSLWLYPHGYVQEAHAVLEDPLEKLHIATSLWRQAVSDAIIRHLTAAN